MTLIAAEEVHGKERRESTTATTTPTSPSMPSPLPPASVCGELLVVWTDLLVGVIAQKEAIA